MLTDEELTRRLSAALHESAPELTFAGPMPHVRRRATGLATTSVVAAAAALVLTPAALLHDHGRNPDAVPSPGTHDTSQRAGHTLDIPGLHLSDASVKGKPGPLYAALGTGLTIPPVAEKVDLGLPVDVYFVDDPPSGQPQVYVESHACPDTNDPCPTPPPTHVYGILAPGWTRQQLIDFLKDPVGTYEHYQQQHPGQRHRHR